MKRKIDFLIIGAQKSGSTSLYHYLRQHPDIFLPEVEENRFFTQEEFYQEGSKFLSIFYNGLRNEKIIGGKNVHIMYFPHAANRVHTYNSEMKLIVILRNPIDRAYSSYWFARRNGWESCKTFEEALEKETLRSKGSYQDQAELTYLCHGHYFEQIERIINIFGPSNVLVLLTDDLKNSTERVVFYTFDWLGVDPNRQKIDVSKRSMVASFPKILWLQKMTMARDSWYRKLIRKITTQDFRFALQRNVIARITNANLKPSAYPQIRQSTRRYLSEYYLPHNEQLSTMIGRDLSHWQMTDVST